MLSIQTSVSKGWLYNEGGFSFDKRYYLDPLYRWVQDREIDKFLEARFPDYAFYNMESNLVQFEFFKPDQVLVGGIQPNLIVAVCLGAELVFYPDKDSDILGLPLENLESIDELPHPEALLEQPLIKKFEKQIISVAHKRPDLTIIPPFFWDISGRATIHGFITTAMKFYGENIFIRIYEDPQFVKSFHVWLAEVYITFIQYFSKLGNIPVSSVHIGECSGTMIGDKHYEEFITPFAGKIGEVLGPIRLHSCGFSDHLLAPIGKIKKLKVLDTGSNTSVAAIRKHFGSNFKIDLAPPVEILLVDSDRGQVVAWLEKTLAENGDGPLGIGYHLEPGYSLENCLAIHEELHQRV